MMRSLLLSLLVFGSSFTGIAQTFSSSPATLLPDNATEQCYPITVSGVGNIDGNYGLASVCINISHSWVSDLDVFLVAPDGTRIPLTTGNGGAGDNYNNTCFTNTAATNITAGAAPFAGTFKPEGYLGSFNNGQNGDGIWRLCVIDNIPGDQGTINSWNITFSSTPAPPNPIPSCSGNAPAGNSCDVATPVCNFNGFCGNTSANYTVNTWPQLSSAFCGTIENNSFISFVAASTSVTFNVWVLNSTRNLGIQMLFYSGGCGSGPVTGFGCYNQIRPNADPNSPVVVTATGLTPGNTYYLMVDGYAGDVCDYVISAGSGVALLNLTTTLPPSTSAVCLGQSFTMTATGGNGVYSWSPPTGLNATTGATVIATPAVTTTYTVTSTDITGGCATPLTRQFRVVVQPNPNLGPDQSASVCPGASANLTTLFTTTGLTTAWTAQPSNTTLGNPAAVSTPGIYQVIATNNFGCRDTARVTVTNDPAPNLGPDRTASICAGAALNLTTQFNTTGLTTVWTIGGSPVADPSAVTVPGTYQVIASNGPSCRDTALIVVSNSPAPSLGVDKAVSVCPGTPVDLTTQFTTTGLTTAWTFGGSPVTTPTAVTAAGVYQLVATNATGCSDTAIVTLSSSPKPNLGADQATAVCSGLPVNLTTLFTTTGLTTAWTLGGTPVANPSAVTIAGTYQVIATNATGCADTALVVVSNTPRPNLGPDQSISSCSGTPVNLAALFTTTGLTTVWTLGGNPVVDPTSIATAGIYQLVGSSSPGCSDTALVNYTLFTAPNLGPDKSASICPGAFVKLSVQYNYAGNSFAWTAIPSGTPITVDDVSNPGTYQLIVSSADGCRDTAVLTVTASPKPNLGPDITQAVCAGNPVDLTAQFVTTGLTPTWTLIPAQTNVANPSAVTLPGTYQLTVLNASGCSDTALVTVTANAKPNLGADKTVSICDNASVNLTTQFVTTGLTTAWTFAGSPVANPNAVNAAGTYQLVATSPAGCSDTAEVLVDILVKPNLGVDLTSRICPGGSSNLTTLFNLTGLTSVWTIQPANTVLADPTIVSTPGNYQVIVTNAGGCRDTAVVTVVFHPKPNLGADQVASICLGGNTNLTTLFTTTGLSTGWTIQPANTPLATPANVNQAGTYQLVVTNTEGCRDTALVNVSFLPKPDLGADRTVQICRFDATVNLTTQFVTTGLTTAWTRQPGDVVVTDPTNVSQAGTYRLIVTNASGCADTAQVVISYFPKPNLGVDRTTSICPNGNVDLTTQFTTTGLTTAWTLAGAPVANPSSVNQAGVYQLIGTNADGCKDTATVTLSINPKPSIGPDQTVEVCPGVTANLTTLFTTTGLTTAWTFGGTPVTTPAAVSAPGVYQLIVTNTSGCADTANVTITTLPKPDLGADRAVQICQFDATVNLTTQFVTTGLTTAWTRQPGNVVVTDPTNVSQAGTYRLIVTNASGCADTAQVVISYFPKPNLGVDRTTSICPNGNVDLTTQFTTTGLTTAWTLAGAPVANPSSVNQAGVYQLIGTNADGCKDTATVTIAINPRPNLGADRAGAFCPGESINLNTTFNLAGLSSAWTIVPAGTAVANPAAVNQGGAYQVIATNSFGCADTATITLTENPKPSLGADKQFNICPNETVNLTTQYNTNNLTVAWTLNGTPVGNPAQVNQPGAYQLIVTNAAGCKDTAVVQVTVVARPNLGADRVVAICANQVVNLTTQFTLTGLTTVWTSGIAPVVDPTTITTAGIYQVIASNAAGCADTALVTITVNPKPNLGIDRVVNICPGSTANLSAQFVTTGFTPVWTFGGAPVANPSSVSSAGVYQLIVTNPEGCRDTATATVVIDPKPNLGADKSVTTCPGTPVDLTTQFNLGGLTASWSFGNLLVANPSSVLAIGTYQVIVANSAGCRDTAQVTVGLNPKPSIGADKSLALCPGATTDLTTHYITTGLTATWSLGGIPVATPNTVAAAGVYMLVATNSVGCADTALLTITASPAPNLVITNPPRVCSPARADLTAASVTAGSSAGLTFTYWNDLNATSPVPDPASVPAGTFYIKATSGAGCTTIRPVVVNEFPRHQVFAGNDTAICTGSTITLRGLVNGGSLGTTTILWSPADSLSSTGSLTTLANPTRTTRYTLTVTITNGTCVYEEKDSILVTVQPPVVANAGRDTVAVRNVPHQLNATGGLVYQWSPAGVLNNANISNPRATINQDTRFVVRVSDLVGCSATDTILVSVVDAVRYFVPNAFSPNGDGLNDVFRAVPIGVMRTEFFRVFNRFGELIFETNQPRAGWDGTFKGKPQQPGNYVWMLKGYGGNGQVIELSGNVMLVR